MSETVYIETSILGYLTARPTRNLVLAANIEVTREWWEYRRSTFKLYISQVVLDEVSQGDSEIAANRLEILNEVPLVELNETVRNLAAQFLTRSNLPPKASDDAVHIAAATVHGLDYLLTWNCKHIANAQIQRKLAEISLDFGYQLPVICTPYELLGESAMLQDEILVEIHKIREEHAKSFNYDLDAMFADWQKKQAESGRKVINLSAKRGLKIQMQQTDESC
ncbi:MULTISPECIES: type II toxin-antitoxin system VapC family toxin [unclassified Nostoc]|uniref:type II toxin-antitoxin system VapC family toxin n=1 Tax=unclassified Nostoc TaxID=2593658 RepID=UPI001F549FEC|nr:MULTISPECIES: type II toxin-antitoxin system VapC family toxin [unclassified Nostoc]